MSHEHPHSTEAEQQEAHAWAFGIGRSVRETLEEVNIAPVLQNRELLQKKLEELLALIPEWTPEHEASYRRKREREESEREARRAGQSRENG